ncbi:MAG: hypothetical protein IKC71_02715 [Clostridia bacterium]|nr:hypothetical protein [Clostridia bacterium]
MSIVLDFFNLLKAFLTKYLDIISLILTAILVGLFTLFLVLTLKRKSFSKWFLRLLVPLNLCFLVLFLDKITLFVLVLFLSSCFYLVLKFLGESKGLKREEKELIDLINLEYKKAEVKAPNIKEEKSLLFDEEDHFLGGIKEKIKEQVIEDEICLDHALNVIKKLKKEQLSFYDKKEVERIEYTLLTTEGEIKGIVKTKVNEGLQQLLKIMAKYSL